MRFVQDAAHEASRELAMDRGSFPNFPGSVFDSQGKAPMRNATVTTIAPTGTLSIIAGCSSGIEPRYALFYTRVTPGDIGVAEMDPLFRQRAAEEGFLTAEMQDVLRREGSLPEDFPVPAGLRQLFATALKIPPDQHVRVQAAFQAHTDNAVSKTVNFGHDASPDQVRDAFLLAHGLGCKGITIYRDGSRRGQTLTCGLTSTC
jgi:ribonucleoside-diphosphate reductase alpha chain